MAHITNSSLDRRYPCSARAAGKFGPGFFRALVARFAGAPSKRVG